MTAEEYEKQKSQTRVKALMYLHAKYPGTEKEVFFTDYTGRRFGEVVHVWAVARAAEIEEICEKCRGGKCRIAEVLKGKDSRPVVCVSKSPRGYSYLEVRWTSGIACKYEPLSGEFGRMYRKSGLDVGSQKMTFQNYESNAETKTAKMEAMGVSETGRNLILAGKAGTGKTHLAVAVAISAMKQGRPALFRLVSTMLDEIQTAIRDSGDYDVLMRRFKTVPCLVLDDLGHENMTAARGSYLHQIIDYRYVHKLQTIITTNAKTIAELCEWDKEEYVMPIVSRILERGKWVLIENAGDYRKKRGADRDGKSAEE